MLSRCAMGLIFAAAMLAPLQAAECVLSSVPTPMLAAGMAEPLCDLVLRCSLGAPGTAVQGMLLLGIDGKLANRVDDQELVVGLTVTVDNGALRTLIPGATASLENGQGIIIRGVDANFDATGNVTLRVSGLRAVTSTAIRAGLGFAGSPS